MLLESQFQLVSLTFHLEVESLLQLPVFKGSLIRGVFGKTFRQTVCIQNRDKCDGCLLIKTCPYIFFFESRRLHDEDSNFHSSHDPHPFVLVPPLEEKTRYHEGDTFSLQIMLIGEGISFLPYCVMVIEEMGRKGLGRQRGTFRLEEIRATDGSVDEIIYTNKERNLLRDILVITSESICRDKKDPKELVFKTITPIRLKSKGVLVDDLDFSIILRAVMRRYSWLSSIYCDELPILPYQDLLAESQCTVKRVSSKFRWRELERYSHRQRQRHRLGGVEGEVRFTGDLTPYLSLMRLGEYLHIGKSTAFGLGRYSLTLKY